MLINKKLNSFSGFILCYLSVFVCVCARAHADVSSPEVGVFLKA